VIKVWLLGYSVAGLLGVAAPFLRETNSHAAAKRGVEAYSSSVYTKAVAAFTEAQQLAPSARGAFNLGTAQIAAGDRERGSATLTEAIKDPALRADSLFNRGNSALAAKAFEHAVRDYTEVLKLRPWDAAAKRNLEIALARQQQQQQQSGAGGQENTKQNDPKQNQQQAPSDKGKQEPKAGQVDLEALLRSVQQQEQEELRRMKARTGEAKVGW
jgi:tetratricopeptide (TPR) repeat protein